MCIHQHILPRILLFNIKLQETQEKGSSQKSDKEKIEKLTLSKKGILAHVHNMLNEVIDTLCKINSVIRCMRMCKKALGLFNITKLTSPNKHVALFDLITTPEPYFIQDTISLHNSVLDLIRNLQLGHYRNGHEAKHRLTTGCMLPTNFDQHDYFMLSKTLSVK